MQIALAELHLHRIADVGLVSPPQNFTIWIAAYDGIAAMECGKWTECMQVTTQSVYLTGRVV